MAVVPALGDAGVGETIGEIVIVIVFVDWAAFVICLSDASAGIRFCWLWVGDFAWAQGSSHWDFARMATCAGCIDGWSSNGFSPVCGCLATWHVKDVEFSAGCFLCGELLGWVVRDMVTIDNVIVPVPGAQFQSIGTLKSECAAPCTGFGILYEREWQLRFVRVP